MQNLKGSEYLIHDCLCCHLHYSCCWSELTKNTHAYSIVLGSGKMKKDIVCNHPLVLPASVVLSFFWSAISSCQYPLHAYTGHFKHGMLRFMVYSHGSGQLDFVNKAILSNGYIRIWITISMTLPTGSLHQHSTSSYESISTSYSVHKDVFVYSTAHYIHNWANIL